MLKLVNLFDSNKKWNIYYDNYLLVFDSLVDVVFTFELGFVNLLSDLRLVEFYSVAVSPWAWFVVVDVRDVLLFVVVVVVGCLELDELEDDDDCLWTI